MKTPEEMMADFIANGGEKQRTPRGRRSPMSTILIETVKQSERTAFLHGIKAERMMVQARTRGQYWCETCEAVWYDVEEAWEALTVSHIKPRNDTASRYERRREPHFRGDDPSNILLDCAPCNMAREPKPHWSAS